MDGQDDASRTLERIDEQLVVLLAGGIADVEVEQDFAGARFADPVDQLGLN